MKKLFLLIFLLSTFSISVNSSFGQAKKSRTTIWDSLTTYSSDYYELQVPFEWRHLPPGSELEHYFEASGLAYPIELNGSPIILVLFVMKVDKSYASLEQAKDNWLAGYHDNPDRVFPEGFTDGAEKFNLPSGQDAYFLNTRFYRKSKELNQSRFDLLMYSEKANAYYCYGVTVQYADYADNGYEFETNMRLPLFAKVIFKHFKLL